MRVAVALSMALAAAAVVPVPAPAAAVSREAVCPTRAPLGPCRADLRFVAARAEVNRVTITLGPSGYRVRDTTAPVVAGSGCRTVNQHEATCPLVDEDALSGVVEGALIVRTGDRGDRVHAPPAGYIDGGSGADTLRGGRYSDVRGSSGPDRLIGTPGGQLLAGGAGDDLILGGGDSDDISGGDGDDRISGGAGRDTISAGAGRDFVRSDDGRRETVRCGAGSDLARPDALDRLIGCERRIRP